MAQTMTVAAHLPIGELEQHYRTAGNAVARSQWQIRRLRRLGFSPQRPREGRAPDAVIRLWAEDKHRLGSMPAVRRV